MTIHLWDHGLSYISVPKCGCTSLKLFFYEVMNGKPYSGDFYGHIHGVYRSKNFWLLPHSKLRSTERLAVVREPVDRIVSAYQSKIVNEKCLSHARVAGHLPKLGLSLEPSLTEFLRRLQSYMAVSWVVYRHFHKLSYFLGRRPSWYSRIFDISRIGDLAIRVAEKTGSSVALPFVNRSADHSNRPAVSDANRARILAIYQEDVALYGRHFTAPA